MLPSNITENNTVRMDQYMLVSQILLTGSEGIQTTPSSSRFAISLHAISGVCLALLNCPVSERGIHGDHLDHLSDGAPFPNPFREKSFTSPAS